LGIGSCLLASLFLLPPLLVIFLRPQRDKE
jgi:predicted RND superfamily exporter protein